MNEDLNKEKAITKEDKEEVVISPEMNKLLNKEIFFTSAVAKSKTTTVRSKKLEAEMIEMYRKINEAISNGEYKITLIVTKDQKVFLQNKGFYVYVNQYNGDKCNVNINWG